MYSKYTGARGKKELRPLGNLELCQWLSPIEFALEPTLQRVDGLASGLVE